VLCINALHQLPPVVRAGGSPALDASMGMTLGICVIAFTLVYFAFLAERMSIELDRQRRMFEARA
jgi:TRAP-type C4-dicarboxylate transport system permease small subunit